MKEFDKFFAHLQNSPSIVDPTQPEITSEVPIEHKGGAPPPTTMPTPSALDTKTTPNSFPTDTSMGSSDGTASAIN
jgi:hypothetical protein